MSQKRYGDDSVLHMFGHTCYDYFYVNRYVQWSCAGRCCWSAAAFWLAQSRRLPCSNALLCKIKLRGNLSFAGYKCLFLLPLFIDGITFGRVPINAQFSSAKLQTIFMLFEIQSFPLCKCKSVAVFCFNFEFGFPYQVGHMIESTVCHCTGLCV